MFTATIEGKEVELKASDLKPKEGYAIITPDSVPDGYFTKEAVENKIKDRLSNATKNKEKELLEDEGFHKRVLSKYNATLEDGEIKGVKKDVDVDSIKKQVAESIKQEYEEKIGAYKQKLDKFTNKGLRSAIVDGANSINIDGQYLQPLVEGGSPYLVRELEDQFAYNEEIDDYAMKDPNGDGFMVDGNGFVTTDKFFKKNEERFKHMQKDTRQKGSNFGLPGNGTATPQGDPFKWNQKKKLDYIKEHGQEGYKELLKSAKNKQKEES